RAGVRVEGDLRAEGDDPEVGLQGERPADRVHLRGGEIPAGVREEVTESRPGLRPPRGASGPDALRLGVSPLSRCAPFHGRRGGGAGQKRFAHDPAGGTVVSNPHGTTPVRTRRRTTINSTPTRPDGRYPHFREYG